MMITTLTPKSIDLKHPSFVNTAMKYKTLDSLEPGEVAVIVGDNQECADDLRLAELGLIVGTVVKLIKTAPLGDPLQLSVRGFHLSLSKELARGVLVK